MRAPCSIENCDRPSKARGWCHAHYMRWYQRGDVGTGPVKHYDSSRKCCVEGCDKPYEARGYCAPHRQRVDKYGEPGPASIRPRVIPDDQATYGLIHTRLQLARGSASNNACVRCGSGAQGWAYDHLDANERVDERGYAFSVDLNHYLPMCTSCHKRFDLDFNSRQQRDEMGRYAAAQGHN